MLSRLLLLLLISGLGFGLTAESSTVQRVKFAQGATVLVWQAGSLVGMGHEVLVGDTPLGTDFMGAGLLAPIAEVDGLSGKSLRLQIASNVPTQIKVAGADQTRAFQLALAAIGENADAGIEIVKRDASTFELVRKTADRPGSPMSQSVEVELNWTDGLPAPAALQVSAIAN